MTDFRCSTLRARERADLLKTYERLEEDLDEFCVRLNRTDAENATYLAENALSELVKSAVSFKSFCQQEDMAAKPKGSE